MVAVSTRYTVTLRFTDGVYQRDAYAYTEVEAINSGLIDARMLSEFGSYFGELLEQRAEPVPH